MRAWLQAAILVTTLGLASAPAQASLTDCTNIYVVKLFFYTNSDARPHAMFGSTSSSTSGSYFITAPSGLPDRTYQQMLAALLTAKSTGQRVSVQTQAANGCDVTLPSAPFMTYVQLEP